MLIKLRNSIFIIILLFLISIINANALNIDNTKLGSINVRYAYGDKTFSNSNIYLYKVADINNQGIFTYTTDFINSTIDISDITTKKDTAVTLSNYITSNNINYFKKGITNNNGKFSFDQLQIGLYLVKTDFVKEEKVTYSSLPILISVPNLDEINNTYLYDIDVEIKTEATNISTNYPNNSEAKPTSSPNTYDSILLYTAVFIISFIIILGVVLYIEINKKKEGIKDEKKSF